MADKTLVIVESPAKAKKIAGYLGSDYVVMASVGHIRDLASKASELPEADRKKPWAKLAVDVDDQFQPFYVVHEKKKKTIADLKKALKDAEAAYLAVLAATGNTSGVPFHVLSAKAHGASREEVLSAVLIGLPAAGAVVIGALPVALEAYESQGAQS